MHNKMKTAKIRDYFSRYHDWEEIMYINQEISATGEYFQTVGIGNDIIYHKKVRNFYLVTFVLGRPKIIS